MPKAKRAMLDPLDSASLSSMLKLYWEGVSGKYDPKKRDMLSHIK